MEGAREEDLHTLTRSNCRRIMRSWTMVNMISREKWQLLLFLLQVAVGSLFNQGFQIVSVLLHPSEKNDKELFGEKKQRKGLPKEICSFYRNKQNYHLDSKLSSMLDVLLSLFTCRGYVTYKVQLQSISFNFRYSFLNWRLEVLNFSLYFKLVLWAFPYDLCSPLL